MLDLVGSGEVIIEKINGVDCDFFSMPEMKSSSEMGQTNADPIGPGVDGICQDKFPPKIDFSSSSALAQRKYIEITWSTLTTSATDRSDKHALECGPNG